MSGCVDNKQDGGAKEGIWDEIRWVCQAAGSQTGQD